MPKTLTQTTTKISVEVKILKTVAVTAVGLAAFATAAGFVLQGQEFEKEWSVISSSSTTDLPAEKGLSIDAFSILSFAPNSTIIPINQLFTKSQFLPLNIDESVYVFGINADVNVTSAKGLIRVILIDKNQKEYLVYETYPLLVSEGVSRIQNSCEETCLLEGIIPAKLKIQIEDANLKIDSIKYSLNRQDKFIPNQDSAFQKKSLQKTQHDYKIQQLNKQIKNNGLKWTAGETSVSKLSYTDKKKLFTKTDGTPVEELPNLQGFEYYKGGIFKLSTDSTPSFVQSDITLPNSWDWRNVNGENWMTSVKNQGPVGNCWIFSLIGAIEAQINLYYNQHFDLDLSEQQFADCSSELMLPMGMADILYPECSGLNQCYPGYGPCVISQHGIADENCDPYAARDRTIPHCTLDYICNDWQDRVWKNANFHDYKFEIDFGTTECPKQTMHLNEENIKKVLIEKGPVNSAQLSWNHSMVLTGYDGPSDWKVIQSCERYNEFCHPVKGCIPAICDLEGEQMSLCINSNVDQSTGSMNPGVWNYECKNGKWMYTGIIYCPEGQFCIDNQCQTVPELPIGTKDCYTYNFSTDLFYDWTEYGPGEGESWWIFKNSWGTGWGEDGYGRIISSLQELGWGSLIIGPYTPPTNQSYWPSGFDGQIRCVDKDMDGYCNWGITAKKPDSCQPTCKAEKDCDDSNDLLGPFDAHFNCIKNKIWGDITQDGKVSAEDLILMEKFLKHAQSPTPEEKKLADLNSNLKIDRFDWAALQKLLEGAITQTDLPIFLGDVNQDKVVNSQDAILVQKYLAGGLSFSEIQKLLADTNANKKVDKHDVNLILNSSVQIITQADLPLEPGDFDDNDQIKSNDVIKVMKYLNPNNKPSPQELLYGDMNLNGKFDQPDLDQIKKMWDKFTIDAESLVPPIE